MNQQPTHGGNIAWAANLSGCSPLDILDFSASINPLGPPQSAIAAIKNGCDRLTAYPDPNYHDLRQALGHYHQLSPDWILPGNGAAELLTWAGRDLAALPCVTLMTPAFSDYGRSLKASGADIIPLPVALDDDWDAALALWLSQITPEQMQGGVILNTPHNPTGYRLPVAWLQACLDTFALVVVDEAFIDFLPPDQQTSLIPVIQQYQHLVVLRSLTKFYSLPGLRIGYAIAHPDRLHRWQQWRDPWSVNVLAEAAAMAVLTDTAFQEQTWHWLPSAREHLFSGLAALPGLQPYRGSANFLLVACHPPISSVVTVQHHLLQRHQILIRDCVSFPELGDRFFRVAVRAESDNQRLLDALRDVLPNAGN